MYNEEMKRMILEFNVRGLLKNECLKEFELEDSNEIFVSRYINGLNIIETKKLND